MSLSTSRSKVVSALKSSRAFVSSANGMKSSNRTVKALIGERDVLPLCERNYVVTCAFPQQIRTFSEEAAATKKAEDAPTSEPPELTFSTPRVEALYKKMAKLSKDEVSIVGQLILDNLGLKIEPDEFYYHGIGKSGGGGKGGAGTAAQEDEVEAEAVPAKKTVDLRLAGFDEKSKIKVIKEVRSIAGLGLKEAKELVESAPTFIQKDLSPESAEELKKKLEEVGAQIELA